MELQQLYGLTCKAVGFVHRSVYAYACGKYLYFYDFLSQHKHLVESPGQGIKAICINSRDGKVAVAEIDNQQPKVFIFDGRTRKLASTIERAGELEVSAMAFSQYGQRFATFSGEPDYKLIVWDLKTNKPLVQATLDHRVTEILFNPLNNNELITLGSGRLTFWQIDELYQKHLITSLHPNLMDLTPTCCSWSPRGGLLVGCEGGEVILQDIAAERPMCDSQGKPVIICKTDQPIQCMSIQRSTVILGLKGSACKSFPLSHVAASAENKTGEVDVFPTITDVASIGFDPYFDKVILCTAGNAIHVFDASGGDLAAAKHLSSEGEYHSSKITGLKFMGDGSRFVASSHDMEGTGSLRIWGTSQGHLLWHKKFGASQNAIDFSEDKGVVATGGEDGVLTVVRAVDSSVKVAFMKKVHTDAIISVAFSLKGDVLATVGKDNKLFFFRIHDDGECAVIGYSKIVGKPLNMAWSTHLNLQDKGLLLVSLGSNELLGLEAPPENCATNDLFIENDVVKMKRVRIDSNATGISSFAPSPGKPGIIVALCNDRKVKHYVLPSDDSGWGGFKGRILQPEFIYRTFKKVGHSLAVCESTKTILSSSTEGKAIIDEFEVEGTNKMIMSAHMSLIGGTTAVDISKDGSVVLAGGMQGDISLYTQGPKAIPDSKALVSTDADVSFSMTDDVITEFKNDSRTVALQTAEPAKVGVRRKLKVLQEKIQGLMEENNQAPSIEQLEYSDFILDTEYVEGWDESVKEERKKVKEKLIKERMEKLIITDRLKEMAWHSMYAKGSSLKSVNTDTLVTNFPIARSSSTKTLQKVMYLRSIEMAENTYLKVNAEEAVEQPGVEEAAEQGGGAKSPTRKEEEKKEASSSPNTAESILYPDSKLCHPKRKRIQIFLLQQVIMKLKEDFNVLHAKMRSNKEVLVDKVNDLNKRAKEITDEIVSLGGSQPEEAMVKIDLDDAEIADSFLEVKDSEVGVERYLSPAEKQRLAEEEAAEAARRAAQKGDNVGERGLKDMMGGTLKKAKASAAMSELERPEWMNMPPEEMSEEQTKELKEFEAQMKLLLEEREKRRKALEAEYKKIRADAIELCTKFDESVKSFEEDKMERTLVIHRKELEVVRLSISLEVSQRIFAAKDTELNNTLEDIKEKRVVSSEDLLNFKHEVDIELEHLESLVQEDKLLDKAFKKDFIDSEEYYDKLLKLFRKRNNKGRSTSDKSGQHLMQNVKRQGVAMGKLNRRMSMLGVGPQDVGKKAPRVPTYMQNGAAAPVEDENDPWLKGLDELGDQEGNQFSQVDPLVEAVDRPEGLDPHWWNKLVDARRAKIEAELVVQKQMSKVLQMQRYLAHLTNADNDLKSKMEQTLKDISDLNSEREYQVWDVDVSIRLKQGQVEVGASSEGNEKEKWSASGDMAIGILLDRQVIEDKNQVIQKHGGQKVDILKAIKDFKKGIYDIEWENNRLDMLEEDWAEKTKEFQLLRVTKSLQAFLKSGEDTSNSSEHAALESRLDHNRALGAKSINEKQKGLNKIQRIMLDVKNHNSELDAQVRELEYAVKQKENAKKGKEEEKKDGKQMAARRMRSLVTERKLVDISKAQAEEISLLQQELERLRRRTFPSFVALRM